jgi:hypothetical protein
MSPRRYGIYMVLANPTNNPVTHLASCALRMPSSPTETSLKVATAKARHLCDCRCRERALEQRLQTQMQRPLYMEVLE